MTEPDPVSVYDWNEPEKCEVLAWVKASERRVQVLQGLNEAPKNTSDFADEWDVSTEAVSHHLKSLRQGGPDSDGQPLVRVLTPNRSRYRLWGLTECGVEVTALL